MINHQQFIGGEDGGRASGEFECWDVDKSSGSRMSAELFNPARSEKRRDPMRSEKRREGLTCRCNLIRVFYVKVSLLNYNSDEM